MNDKHPILQERLNSLTPEICKLLISNNLLNLLISRELARFKIDQAEYDPQVIEDTKKNIIRNKNLKSEEDIQLWLDGGGVTGETFHEYVVRMIKEQNYILSNFGHMAESLFLKKQDDLDYATYSLIRVEDQLISQELYMRIKESEESFEDVASKYSIGPEKDFKGLIGPIQVGKGHEQITQLIRTSEIGQVQGPIQINLDNKEVYLIFRLENLYKSKLDEQMKLNLSKEVFQTRIEEETKILVDSIKLKYQL